MRGKIYVKVGNLISTIDLNGILILHLRLGELLRLDKIK